MPSLESSTWWAGFFAIVFTAAAALSGSLAWLLNERLTVKREAAAAKQREELNVGLLELEKQRGENLKLRLEIAEIQERARPRTIDPNARAVMITALGFGSPSKTVSVEYVSGSTNEPYEFAKAIADMLREGGWTITLFDGGPALGNPPIGLTIRVPDLYGDVGTAAILADIFNRGSLNASVVRDATMEKAGEVKIVVGLKP